MLLWKVALVRGREGPTAQGRVLLAEAALLDLTTDDAPGWGRRHRLWGRNEENEVRG